MVKWSGLTFWEPRSGSQRQLRVSVQKTVSMWRAATRSQILGASTTMIQDCHRASRGVGRSCNYLERCASPESHSKGILPKEGGM